jgi:hypothetical protein
LKKHVVVNYRVETSKLGAEWDGYRFIMLSDFHNNSYGVDEKKVLADIDRHKPECIMVAGDMYTGKQGLDNLHAKNFMRELSEKYTVYYSVGNHEQRMEEKPEIYGDMYEQFFSHMKNCGIKLLQNESVVLKMGTSKMEITGLQLDNCFYQKFRRTAMPQDYMDTVLGRPDTSRFQVLLAHNPVYFKEYAQWGADLILAGHLHGGMAKLPGIGGIIAPNYRLFPKYDSGMYEEYGSTMILGAGIGTHTVHIRPFNPAEIVVVTIHTCNPA